MEVALDAAVSPESIEFLNIGTVKWYELNICINWFAVLLGAVLIYLIVKVVKKVLKNSTKRTVSMDGMSFGIGNIECHLKCNDDVREIAYKLWVELTTRKIAIPLEDDDVITELYDSWYEAFSSIRGLLKSVPGKCFDDAADLIDLTTKVLNEGLRPHLTKWQAKYRSWYEMESKNSHETPQEIQKRYPEYTELISDMKKTNQNMINFANKMHEIAFGVSIGLKKPLSIGLN